MYFIYHSQLHGLNSDFQLILFMVSSVSGKLCMLNVGPLADDFKVIPRRLIFFQTFLFQSAVLKNAI